jgi:Double zinc ribbon
MLVALFGITNSGLNLFVNLVILFLVVVYVALIAWTYFDARRRIDDDVLVGCATAAAIFPFVGPLVYSIIRPPEYLEDAHERELEIRAAELRVRQLEEQSCPNCGHPIERTYLRCPSCRGRVKDPCESCGKPIDPRWTICPYCETPLRRAAPPPRRAAEAPARPSPATPAKPASRPEGRRQPATTRPARSARKARPATASRQAAASRQSAGSKQRKPSSTRTGSSRPPTREAPGEDRPRPATAS